MASDKLYSLENHCMVHHRFPIRFSLQRYEFLIHHYEQRIRSAVLYLCAHIGEIELAHDCPCGLPGYIAVLHSRPGPPSDHARHLPSRGGH